MRRPATIFPSGATAILVCLFALASAGVAQQVERDVAYGRDTSQRLDLRVPEGNGFPTVVFIHGGSLTGDDKDDDNYRDVCSPFPGSGIACASINYRLAPGHPWPAQAQDAATAAAWVRANIGSRGGDTSAIFLFGHSSGALIAAVLGTEERFLEAEGLELSDVAGVIPMGSIMWDVDQEEAIKTYGRERIEEAFLKRGTYRIYRTLDRYIDHWPIHHIREGMPPMLFLIAEGERINPPVLKTDSTFVALARAKGNVAEYRVLPDRKHYTAIRKLGEPGDPTFAIIRDFVRKYSRGGKK